MKIALIQTPMCQWTMPSLGMGYLTAYLKKRNNEVILLDFNIELQNKKEVYDKLKNFKIYTKLFGWEISNVFLAFLFPDYYPETIKKFHNEYSLIEKLCERWVKKVLDVESNIICFSVSKTSSLFSLLFAKKIKEKDKKKIIIFGGPESLRERNAYFFINTNLVDLIIIGEGELTLAEIIFKLERKKEIKNTKGTIVNHKGKIIDNRDRDLISNLDILPFPDFEKLSSLKIFQGQLPITTSRGCVAKCRFCDQRSFWNHYRHRSVGNIVKELEYQIDKYKVNNFRFCDSLINGNIGLLSKLCDELIKKGVNIRWGGEVRIDPKMSQTLLNKMYNAGCRWLAYGIESASQNLLNVMNKGINVQDIRSVLKKTKNARIWTNTYWLVGFPTETNKDFQITYDFLINNKDVIDAAYFQEIAIESSTPLYKMRTKFNIKFLKLMYPKELDYCCKYLKMQSPYLWNPSDRTKRLTRLRIFLKLGYPSWGPHTLRHKKIGCNLNLTQNDHTSRKIKMLRSFFGYN